MSYEKCFFANECRKVAVDTQTKKFAHVEIVVDTNPISDALNGQLADLLKFTAVELAAKLDKLGV